MPLVLERPARRSRAGLESAAGPREVLAGRVLGGMVGARALQAASELFAGWHHPGGTAT